MVGELSIIWDKGWEVLNELLIWFQECWPRKEQSLHVVPMCCHHLTHTPFARENCGAAKDEESFRVLARCRLEIKDLSTATAWRHLCTRKRLYTDIFTQRNLLHTKKYTQKLSHTSKNLTANVPLPNPISTLHHLLYLSTLKRSKTTVRSQNPI